MSKFRRVLAVGLGLCATPACFEQAQTVDTSSTGDTGSRPAEAIILYPTQAVRGDFLAQAADPRQAVDEICTQSKPGSLDCDSFHAVLCVSPADNISALELMFEPPTDVPVVGPTGLALATSWTVFAGPEPTLERSLTNALVVATPTWTGSDDLGLTNDHCAGWSTLDSFGDIADVASEGFAWKNGIGEEACAQSFPLLCACWAGF